MTITITKNEIIERTCERCLPDIRRGLFENERVLVFDVDGVLVEQINTCFKGENGQHIYRVNLNAKRVIEEAEKRVDEVVLWSSMPNYLNYFKGKLFRKIPYHIFGTFQRNGSGESYKPLIIINRNFRNVVGIEDNRMFYPRDRVVRVYRGRNLIEALWEALDKF